MQNRSLAEIFTEISDYFPKASNEGARVFFANKQSDMHANQAVAELHKSSSSKSVKDKLANFQKEIERILIDILQEPKASQADLEKAVEWYAFVEEKLQDQQLKVEEKTRTKTDAVSDKPKAETPKKIATNAQHVINLLISWNVVASEDNRKIINALKLCNNQAQVSNIINPILEDTSALSVEKRELIKLAADSDFVLFGKSPEENDDVKQIQLERLLLRTIVRNEVDKSNIEETLKFLQYNTVATAFYNQLFRNKIQFLIENFKSDFLGVSKIFSDFKRGTGDILQGESLAPKIILLMELKANLEKLLKEKITDSTISQKDKLALVELFNSVNKIINSVELHAVQEVKPEPQVPVDEKVKHKGKGKDHSNPFGLEEVNDSNQTHSSNSDTESGSGVSDEGRKLRDFSQLSSFDLLNAYTVAASAEKRSLVRNEITKRIIHTPFSTDNGFRFLQVLRDNKINIEQLSVDYPWFQKVVAAIQTATDDSTVEELLADKETISNLKSVITSPSWWIPSSVWQENTEIFVAKVMEEISYAAISNRELLSRLENSLMQLIKLKDEEIKAIQDFIIDPSTGACLSTYELDNKFQKMNTDLERKVASLKTANNEVSRIYFDAVVEDPEITELERQKTQLDLLYQRSKIFIEQDKLASEVSKRKEVMRPAEPAEIHLFTILGKASYYSAVSNLEARWRARLTAPVLNTAPAIQVKQKKQKVNLKALPDNAYSVYQILQRYEKQVLEFCQDNNSPKAKSLLDLPNSELINSIKTKDESDFASWFSQRFSKTEYNSLIANLNVNQEQLKAELNIAQLSNEMLLKTLLASNEVLKEFNKHKQILQAAGFKLPISKVDLSTHIQKLRDQNYANFEEVNAILHKFDFLKEYYGDSLKQNQLILNEIEKRLLRLERVEDIDQKTEIEILLQNTKYEDVKPVISKHLNRRIEEVNYSLDGLRSNFLAKKVKLTLEKWDDLGVTHPANLVSDISQKSARLRNLKKDFSSYDNKTINEQKMLNNGKAVLIVIATVLSVFSAVFAPVAAAFLGYKMGESKARNHTYLFSSVLPHDVLKSSGLQPKAPKPKR